MPPKRMNGYTYHLATGDKFTTSDVTICTVWFSINFDLIFSTTDRRGQRRLDSTT